MRHCECTLKGIYIILCASSPFETKATVRQKHQQYSNQKVFRFVFFCYNFQLLDNLMHHISFR